MKRYGLVVLMSLLFATGAYGQVFSSGAGGIPYTAFPLCADSAGQHLNFDNTTNTFTCGTSGGGAASASWSTLTDPTGNLSLSMASRTSLFTYGATTGSAELFSLVDGSSNTGTGHLLFPHTAASSAAKPFAATAGGTANGVEISTAGQLAKIGSGSVKADVLALTSTPTACSGNNFALGITTTGASACAQPAFSNLSGSVAAAQLPNPSASTLGGVQSFAAVSNQFVTSISTSGVVAAAQPAFTNISGTAAFGQGGTGLASAADDTVMVSSGSAWVAKAITDCIDTGGNHLNYTAATNAFSCGTSGGGGGGATTALDNLASVAINASLLPGTSGTPDLGSATLHFGNAYLGTSTNAQHVKITHNGSNAVISTPTGAVSFPDGTGTYSDVTAIGAGAVVSGDNCVSLGKGTTCGGVWGVQLGTNANTSGAITAIAIGGTATAGFAAAQAYGYGASATAAHQVTFGCAGCTYGEAEAFRVVGTAPTVTANCGTSPSVTGSNTAGKLNVGTGGTATTCTITFSQAFTAAPACVAQDEDTALLLKAKSSTTTLVITAATPFTASDLVSYICIQGS